MEKQTYKNHIRFYPPHHFVYYPVLMALLAASIYFSFTKEETLIWTFISIVFVVFILLGLMLRQHYALTLQNRIVRLELRYRYFTLTGKRFEPIESQLQDAQLFALRFASDAELPDLTDRALSEKYSGDAIKKSITNWKGDYERV